MQYKPPQTANNAENLATCCVLCSQNCGLRVDIQDNKIVAVRADKTNPITQGYSCNKGYSIAHYADHKQRVQEPLKRQADGTFQAISWDVAIAEIAAKLNELRFTYTGRSIGLVGVGGQANHLDGSYALAFLQGVGSQWWFNALAQEKTQHALVDKWLFDAYPTSHFHPDVEHSEYVLMIGSNPLLSNRGLKATEFVRELTQDPNRTLVVVDPRRSETARKADLHLPVKPGGDVYLLLALVNIILNEGLYDASFTQRYVDNLDALQRHIGSLNVEQLAEHAGLSVSEIASVARGFARAESASIFVDLGLEQSRYSTLTAYLMRVLAGLTGNLGNKGGMIFMGLFGAAGPSADVNPFVAPESGIEAISMWAPFGAFSYNLVPEEILAERHDRIRGVIVEGSNPILQAADTPKWREAFAKLDLLVVIDPAMSETAQYADYVLPATCGYEKWEYAGFPKGFPGVYAQVRPPVLKGPEQALPEPEIYRRLCHEMGLIDEMPRPARWLGERATRPWVVPFAVLSIVMASLSKTLNLRSLLPRMLFGLYETLGKKLPSPSLTFIWFTCLTYAMAHRKDLLRVHPHAKRYRTPFSLGRWLFEQLMKHPEGFHVGNIDESNNLDTILRTKDGKIRFAQSRMFGDIQRVVEDTLLHDETYPLILNGGMRTRWNANSVQRDPNWRKGKGPHCSVWVSPDDADKLSLQTGEQVRVSSRTGSVELPLLVDASVTPGHIHIPNGFGQKYPDESGKLQEQGVNLNELTDSQSRDPWTGCPYHKYVPCRIEAI